MSSSRRRQPKKESYWREQVAKWRASGLSQAEFSRRAGISDKSLGHWKRRFEREGLDKASAPTIAPAPIAPPAEQAIPRQPIIIHAGGGFRLEIAGDFNPTDLEKVLRTLERLA
jgi:hypothetical protein